MKKQSLIYIKKNEKKIVKVHLIAVYIRMWLDFKLMVKTCTPLYLILIVELLEESSYESRIWLFGSWFKC